MFKVGDKVRLIPHMLPGLSLDAYSQDWEVVERNFPLYGPDYIKIRPTDSQSSYYQEYYRAKVYPLCKIDCLTISRHRMNKSPNYVGKFSKAVF